MRLTRIASIVFLGLAAGNGVAQDPSPAKLWMELDQLLPRHSQVSPITTPSSAIDWAEQVTKTEQVMVRAGGTPVEPYSMFYLGNFFFESGRLDEAQALFETIKQQFPDSPLVKLAPSKEHKPLVEQAIDDCASEIAFRARHPRAPVPSPVLDPNVTATLKTSAGDIKIRFYKNVTPKHVENFLKHATAGDYDGTKVGQIIQESVINMGDPASKGPQPPPGTPPAAGPTQPHEFANLSHVRGAVVMARSMTGIDSNTMAFQIYLKDQSYFDFTQTIFGRVVEGIEVADAIARMPKDQFQKPAPEVVLKGITVSQP